MSAFAMISGRLWKAPEAKTAKAGQPFAVATVRVAERERAVFWSIVAFGEVAEELLQLEDGDSVSVSGPFSTETYVSKDGETRVSHKLTADRLASPRIGRAANSPSRGGRSAGSPTESGAA
jgi:single-stranded DNA-binding protein